MKLRPILFGAPMVQAILEGRKTQTRRVVKPQPISLNTTQGMTVEQFRAKGQELEDMGLVNIIHGTGGHVFPKCPYGKTGDVLWVRETWNGVKDLSGEFSHYRFKGDNDPSHNGMRWKPSIHMPFEAARIFLEITNVRVERLMDISEQDAINEGVERKQHLGLASCTWYRNYMYKDICFQFAYPTHSFQSLWQSINGSESLIANPWVWVLEFKRINKPTL